MKFVLNIRLILKIFGYIAFITAIAMLPAVITAFVYGENAVGRVFLLTGVVVAVAALACIFLSHPKKQQLKTRDGYFAVGFGWLTVIVIGAVPYLASGYTDSFCAAFFESAAGFTTTGATVFTVESVPRAFLMWKAVSHWVGGMGILVFTVSLLPTLGASGHKIFRVEVPAPSMDKIVSKISSSAKILYSLYIGFTVLEFLLLAASGINVFDNLICTLGCISTAGLSPYVAGISQFQSTYVESVIILFTLLASINFSLYAFAVQGNFRAFFRNTELRVFLAILFVSSVLVSGSLFLSDTFETLPQAIRHGVFQVVSFASTTGYSLDDYTLWPPLCTALFLLLMLMGGCASSTCGSLKMIRVIVMFKLAMRALYRRIHPRAVVALKVEGKPVSAEVASQITSFVIAFFFILLSGTLILSLQGFDFVTNLSSATAMLTNTGIGFGAIGSSGNFSLYAAPLQLLLAFLMIIGRLEIFTFLLLLSPSFWHPDRVVD